MYFIKKFNFKKYVLIDNNYAHVKLKTERLNISVKLKLKILIKFLVFSILNFIYVFFYTTKL